MRAYHLSPAAHALGNLRHRRLKIATFNDLNDPFELWAVAQPNPSLRRALRRLKKVVSKKYGLLCFSKDWHNPVLWSHYADRHRGIALGFDIDDKKVKEVIYSEGRPRFQRADQEVVDILLYTKYLDWHYEQEVRIGTLLKEQDPATKLYFAKFSADLILREVITGPLCDTTKEELEAALKEQDIEIIKGRLAFRTFRVVKDKRGLRPKSTNVAGVGE